MRGRGRVEPVKGVAICNGFQQQAKPTVCCYLFDISRSPVCVWVYDVLLIWRLGCVCAKPAAATTQAADSRSSPARIVVGSAVDTCLGRLSAARLLPAFHLPVWVSLHPSSSATLVISLQRVTGCYNCQRLVGRVFHLSLPLLLFPAPPSLCLTTATTVPS